MKDNRILNIIDENDKIIGQDTRENIHRKGLLHREIHVWFYTPRGEIIFQHRAKDKDTFPDLLDATVGGHVEIGDDYVKTAIKETREETGLKIDKKDLIFITKIHHTAIDLTNHRINKVIRFIYGFCYKNSIGNLKIEKKKAIGFKAWPIKKLLNISVEDKKYFIPSVFDKDNLEVFEKILHIIKNQQ